VTREEKGKGKPILLMNIEGEIQLTRGQEGRRRLTITREHGKRETNSRTIGPPHDGSRQRVTATKEPRPLL